jgi:histidine triad (HIT) family protein
MAATSCVFCRILQGELTPNVVAYRDAWTAVFPSRLQHPKNRGHMLVVPIRHVANIYDLDSDLAGPILTTLARVSASTKKVCAADGISVRQNNEQAGGQDVFHLHFHVIPRFTDDGFMGLDSSQGVVEVPVEQRIAEARKLAESLQKLRP